MAGGWPSSTRRRGQAPGPRGAAQLLARETHIKVPRLGAAGPLAPTAEDKHWAREALLGMLAHETNDFAAVRLADGLAQLDPTAEDKRRARDALFRDARPRDPQPGRK